MFITNLNSRDRIMDNLFDELNTIFTSSGYPKHDWRNSTDYKIDSDENGVILTMNVPGYNDKLIDVSVSGAKLTIEGKSHTGSTEGFIHTFTINDNLDADGIDATVIDGILTVSIPYAEEVKPRKIKVKVK